MVEQATFLSQILEFEIMIMSMLIGNPALKLVIGCVKSTSQSVVPRCGIIHPKSCLYKYSGDICGTIDYWHEQYIRWGTFIGQNHIYRVTMVVVHLGWVDLHLGCSTILLGQ